MKRQGKILTETLKIKLSNIREINDFNAVLQRCSVEECRITCGSRIVNAISYLGLLSVKNQLLAGVDATFKISDDKAMTLFGLIDKYIVSGMVMI